MHILVEEAVLLYCKFEKLLELCCTLNFELITGSSLYNKNEGIAIDDRHDNECLLFDITPKDVHDLITSGSFLGTVFDT
jgi:hypothetical protein